ncbi:hypothetical protein ACFQ9J_17835 [Streptomyces sp. NPDC056529]|uniref:BP74-related protein n=1 Tax=Streptomyces sp. NPDC056529 TaxID=3345855 RepID=UPI0036B01CAF
MKEFVFKLTEDAKIGEARRILSREQKDRIHVMGRIVERPISCNPGWSFHLEPHTISACRGARYARALTSSRASVRRHRDVEEVLAHYQSRYAVGCWTVWGNRPPADVWQLRRPARLPARAALDIPATLDTPAGATR